MATFVLVHGAFIGGWAFGRVAALLRAKGHQVFAPTLTGTGERIHLLRPDVNYSTHVNDIANVIKYEGLTDVVLVGHSYAGLVVTGVADRLPNHVSQLVYLDSQIATHGQNAMGGSPGGTTDKLSEMSANDGPKMLPPISLDAMGIVDAADRAWVEPLLCAHPMACLEEFVMLENGDPKMPRSYIYCTDRASMSAFFGGDPLTLFVDKAKNEGFRFYEIASGHHPMMTRPGDLADILETIAASSNA